ncbi:MAG: ABC transporter ATP-binding protein [Clostridiaceae bacterium]|nr:ABC transporter ATP-binding protein [Clostridiaceae bacterium]
MKTKWALFNKIRNAGIVFFGENRSGEINYRLFNDTDTLDRLYNILFIGLPLDIITILFLGITIFIWNWQLAIFIFLVLIVQAVLIVKQRKKILANYQVQKMKTQHLYGNVVEFLRNINLIKGMGMEEFSGNSFREGLNELKEVNIKTFMVNNLTSVLSSMINNLWTFGILWYGGKLTLRGEITLGTLMGLLIITNMLYPRISSITGSILSFQEIGASMMRFLEYYNIPQAVAESREAKPAVVHKGDIRFENVSFAYDRGPKILDNVSFLIEAKKATAIIGSNGAGKSTICKLIARFFDPVEGRITIDGEDIKDFTLASLRSVIRYQPQNEFLLSGTILENITCGEKAASEEEVLEAVRKAKIASFIEQLPDGLNTRIGEGGLQLSGGQAQRIALARIYYHKPPIVILDEPTAFIDAEGESLFNEIIRELKEQCTVIVVAHRQSTISMADNKIQL